MGQGRASDQGLHAHDSLKLSVRQYPSKGRIKEDLSLATNTNLDKDKLQTGDADLSLQFRGGGYTLGSEAGLTYTSILYNKLNRVEITKSKASLDLHYGVNLGKSFTLDADSLWEWSLGGGYDDYGGQFKTGSGYTSLDFSWTDFEVLAEASGYQQNQSSGSRSTDCKRKSGRLCLDGSGTSGPKAGAALGSDISVKGLGISMEGEWDHGDHLLAVKTGMDWQLESVSARIISMGSGYTYSPFAWLGLGVYVQWEKDLDATTRAIFRVVGVSLSLKI